MATSLDVLGACFKVKLGDDLVSDKKAVFQIVALAEVCTL